MTSHYRVNRNVYPRPGIEPWLFEWKASVIVVKPRVRCLLGQLRARQYHRYNRLTNIKLRNITLPLAFVGLGLVFGAESLTRMNEAQWRRNDADSACLA